MLKGISFINTRKRQGKEWVLKLIFEEHLEVTVDWRSSSNLQEHIGSFLYLKI